MPHDVSFRAMLMWAQVLNIYKVLTMFKISRSPLQYHVQWPLSDSRNLFVGIKLA